MEIESTSIQGSKCAELPQGEIGLILSQWMRLQSPQRPLNLEWPHGVVHCWEEEDESDGEGNVHWN